MYSREMLAGLLDAVKSKTLSAENRFILHADLFALVTSTLFLTLWIYTLGQIPA